MCTKHWLLVGLSRGPLALKYWLLVALAKVSGRGRDCTIPWHRVVVPSGYAGNQSLPRACGLVGVVRAQGGTGFVVPSGHAIYLTDTDDEPKVSNQPIR